MLLGLLLAASLQPQPQPAPHRPWNNASHLPRPSLFSLTAFDAPSRVVTTFIFRLEGGDYVVDRDIGRLGRDGVEGRTTRELPASRCPGLRTSLETVARLPMPPPFVEGMSARPSALPANRSSYELDGSAIYPSGQRGSLRLTSAGSDGAAPSPLEAWSRSLMRTFQDCADRAPAPAEEGR